MRHLVLPNGVGGTPQVMKFIAEHVSPHTYVNIMAQYRPCGRIAPDDPIGGRARTSEFYDAVNVARDAGLYRLD